MSEEPRRSVRATKGQHTKSLDILDQPAEPTKKRSGKKGSSKKAASQEAASNDGDDGDIVRCVCGATTTDDDSDENWICCEKCAAWQHNVCVGMPDEVPDDEEYWCEQCKPENHKELLEAEAKGHHLWQDRRKVAEAKKKKKGGKKGKGKRTSDQKSDVGTGSNGVRTSPAVESTPEVKKEKKETGRAAAAKRKTRDESQESTAGKPQSKVRRVSAQSKGLGDLSDYVPISELDKARQGVATFINKHMLSAVQLAVKNESFVSHDNKSPEDRAMQLTLAVERAVHESHPQEGYAAQGRAIGFALTRNHKIFERLNDGELSPQELASMTPEDMATDEMKKKNAEMLAKAERQSTMIQDDGPRIRRTHKGDEVIEQDTNVPSTEEPPAARRRSMLDPNAGMTDVNPRNEPLDQVGNVQGVDEYRSKDDIRGRANSKSSASAEPPKVPLRKVSTPSNFDIKKIMSSVPSPTHTQPRRTSAALPAQGPGVDPEVDRMLEDGNESDEYEPAEFDADPSIVWRGSLLMQSVASFPAVARYVGGADLNNNSHAVSYADILNRQLSVAGRIQEEQGSEYLCGLRYSAPTDVVVLELSPVGEAAAQDFHKLYDYFISKKRFGVLGNRGFANVRDTYLIPVPPGSGNTPEFMLNLQDNKLPETRENPTILVTVVVRTEPKSTPDLVQGTPTGAFNAQRQMSVSSSTGPNMSPVNAQGAFSPYSTQAPNQNSMAGNLQSHHQNNELLRRKQDEEQRRGVILAQSILGPLIQAPTMSFILPQAHAMQEVEWKKLRDILEAHPRARDDLPFLSDLLAKNAPDSVAENPQQNQGAPPLSASQPAVAATTGSNRH